MLNVIFTLDYEIHGDGEGSPRKLMIEPTQRLLRLFARHGAKVTIMAEIGEILKFKEYAEAQKRDDYNYGEIVSQLQDAVARGHDVQLHIHSSYFNARHDGSHWVQDWGEYNFADLSLDRMCMMVKQGKEWLESILRPVNPNYRCFAFRAANWSVSPARNVVRALLKNDFKIDTSIFKYGVRTGLVRFDYSHAYSDVTPWPVSEEDLCVKDSRGRLWEFPIYSEKRPTAAFLTVNRAYRVAQEWRHRIANLNSVQGPIEKADTDRWPGMPSKMSLLTKKHPWKADFNQCTGRQLIHALHRAERKVPADSGDSPFVLIGHSKVFSRWNELSLRPFLKHVARHPQRFGFGTFGPFVSRLDPATASELAASGPTVAELR